MHQLPQRVRTLRTQNARSGRWRSGAKTDRAQLRKAIATLEADDVLMVTRLDRLARSTRDRLNTLAAITERKAGFRLARRHMGPTPRHHTGG